MRNKRLKSHSHEWWHPRSTPTSGAGSGASQMAAPKTRLDAYIMEFCTEVIL